MKIKFWASNNSREGSIKNKKFTFSYIWRKLNLRDDINVMVIFFQILSFSNEVLWGRLIVNRCKPGVRNTQYITLRTSHACVMFLNKETRFGLFFFSCHTYFSKEQILFSKTSDLWRHLTLLNNKSNTFIKNLLIPDSQKQKQKKKVFVDNLTGLIKQEKPQGH